MHASCSLTQIGRAPRGQTRPRAASEAPGRPALGGGSSESSGEDLPAATRKPCLAAASEAALSLCSSRGNGEALGLELDHVDFLHGEVRIEQQLVVQSGGVPYLGQVKTDSSNRTVELPQVTATRSPGTWSCNRRSRWRSRIA